MQSAAGSAPDLHASAAPPRDAPAGRKGGFIDRLRNDGSAPRAPLTKQHRGERMAATGRTSRFDEREPSARAKPDPAWPRPRPLTCAPPSTSPATRRAAGPDASASPRRRVREQGMPAPESPDSRDSSVVRDGSLRIRPTSSESGPQHRRGLKAHQRVPPRRNRSTPRRHIDMHWSQRSKPTAAAARHIRYAAARCAPDHCGRCNASVSSPPHDCGRTGEFLGPASTSRTRRRGSSRRRGKAWPRYPGRLGRVTGTRKSTSVDEIVQGGVGVMGPDESGLTGPRASRRCRAAATTVARRGGVRRRRRRDRQQGAPAAPRDQRRDAGDQRP